MSGNAASDQGVRRGLVRELGCAVRRLVDGTEQPVRRDDGSLVTGPVPGLLAQLRAAVHTGRETRLVTPRQGVPTPICVAAHDLVAELDREVASLHREVLELSWAAAGTEQRLRHIAHLAAGWDDLTAIAWVLRRVQRWTQLITGLLDPPRQWHLAAPCPACGTRMVHRVDPAGDTVLAPALVVDADGARCQACAARWPPDHLDHLARVLAG